MTIFNNIPFAYMIYRYAKQLKNFKILALDFGQWRSIKQRMPVDREGNPIPWYTYPAIEYLKELDLSDKTIFEWGSGNSSLFWARRGKEILSIEHNRKWFNIVSRDKADNQEIILLERKNDYVEAILCQHKKFDIIVIDGKYRYECSTNAIKCLTEGGLLILDNSDWYPKTAEILREHGLTKIDFNGLGPVNDYAWTTSLFLTRNFSNNFRFNQPIRPIGGLNQCGNKENR